MVFENKSILLTGGTGSFGRAFTRRILQDDSVKRLIIYSRDEFKQYQMKREMEEEFGEQKCEKLRFFIGDVRDERRLLRALTEVDYVIHAAAMKQVPACEYNPFEAIKTNIHGAQNVIEAALERNVKKVVALSTDKAVNPINLYGGTKLVSDKLFVSANAYSGKNGTVFSVVRYGNVAASRGSVIPLFAGMVRNGCKQLPITDPRMTRFWISLDQGIDLVGHALKHSKGGETFISKIPSFNIVDLAEAFTEHREHDIVGIREGEKLHEVMITDDDSRQTYEYRDHYIIYPNFEWWDATKHYIEGGRKVEDGFAYRSDINGQWLDVAGLKKLVNAL